MINHKSFVLNKDLLYKIEPLPISDVGILFISILEFVNNKPVLIPERLSKLYNEIIEGIKKEWERHNPQTGKYHWNYKYGISPANKVIRNSVETKIWRLKVFERDKFTCQECFIKGGVLHAHHLKEFAKYPALRFDVDNGKTLCKKCHNQKHRKNG